MTVTTSTRSGSSTGSTAKGSGPSSSTVRTARSVRAFAVPRRRRCPYILVVGDSDVENGTVGVNKRGSDEPERDVRVDEFVLRLAADVAEHA